MPEIKPRRKSIPLVSDLVSKHIVTIASLLCCTLCIGCLPPYSELPFAPCANHFRNCAAIWLICFSPFMSVCSDRILHSDSVLTLKYKIAITAWFRDLAFMVHTCNERGWGVFFCELLNMFIPPLTRLLNQSSTLPDTESVFNISRHRTSQKNSDTLNQSSTLAYTEAVFNTSRHSTLPDILHFQTFYTSRHSTLPDILHQ